MKLLLTHIADPDGITPIILLKLLNLDFEYELFEATKLSEFILEKINTDYFEKFEDIFIVDLGINKECADKIENSKHKNKFRIFDHHESNNFLNNYEFGRVIEEVDGFKECGTSIFFSYLVSNYENSILTKESVVTFVELVRENDTWQFTELEEDAHNLSALFGFYGKDTYIDVYTEFLKKNEKFHFNRTELLILKSLNRQMSEYLEEAIAFNYMNIYGNWLWFFSLISILSSSSLMFFASTIFKKHKVTKTTGILFLLGFVALIAFVASLPSLVRYVNNHPLISEEYIWDYLNDRFIPTVSYTLCGISIVQTVVCYVWGYHRMKRMKF